MTESFPPDIAHDLFEGIIPVEIALCLTVLISKKYFTLANLNEAITTFPFKWTDKTPHLVPLTFATKRTIGGNAHDNWSLLRFLPLLIGARIPSNEPAWQVLCDLKDIVELAVAPLHTEDSISYLDFKISEHRAVFQEVFPHEKIRPKLHFLFQEKCFKKLDAWYLGHYRAYDLVIYATKQLQLVGVQELTDPYPLAHYMVGGRRIISLKRYIHA